MNKMVWISVEKEGSSWTGGMYSSDSLESSIKKIQAMGYRIVSVD